jgi:hypothetical protein
MGHDNQEDDCKIAMYLFYNTRSELFVRIRLKRAGVTGFVAAAYGRLRRSREASVGAEWL